jgi:hypothetical protein
MCLIVNFFLLESALKVNRTDEVIISKQVQICNRQRIIYIRIEIPHKCIRPLNVIKMVIFNTKY